MEVILDRYEKGKKFATGGLGVQYKGRDLVTGAEVAIKQIFEHVAAAGGVLRKVEKGVDVVVNFRHPNLLKVYASGRDKGKYYVVTEFISGTDLSRILKNSGPMEPEVAACIISDVCSGLAYAYEHGMQAHRDIKPSNIMIEEGGRVVLTDFDTAKRREILSVTKSVVLFTERYAAPEIIVGRPGDQRSDIFSLGMALYELLTGVSPFKKQEKGQSSLVEDLSRVLHRYPQSLRDLRPDVPADLEKAVFRTLEKDPNDRFSNILEFKGVLSKFTSDSARAEIKIRFKGRLLRAGPSDDEDSTKAKRRVETSKENILSPSVEIEEYLGKQERRKVGITEGRAFFLIVKGTEEIGEKKTFRLEDSGLLIGRGSSCHVILEDKTISRRHAQILPEDGGFLIQDLESRNGVYVNGARIRASHRLSEGDVIQIGKAFLTFTSVEGAPVDRRGESGEPIGNLPSPGDQVSRFTIQEPIHIGGHCAVFRARWDETQTDVVLKMLTPDAAGREVIRESFLRCPPACREVKSHHLAEILDIGEWRGLPYIALQYFEGPSFKQIAGEGPICLEEALEYALQVCEVLSLFEEKGIVCRRLRSDQFILDHSAEKVRVVLCDDGFTCWEDYASLTVEDLLYLPREQIVGIPDIDPRGNLYSFGVVLYELITGKSPFEGTTKFEVESGHIRKTPAPPKAWNGEIPDELNEVILRTLRKERAARYQNASELRAALEKALSVLKRRKREAEVWKNRQVAAYLLDGLADRRGEIRVPSFRALTGGLRDFGLQFDENIVLEDNEGVSPWIGELSRRVKNKDSLEPLLDFVKGFVVSAQPNDRGLIVGVLSAVFLTKFCENSSRPLLRMLYEGEVSEKAVALWGLMRTGDKTIGNFVRCLKEGDAEVRACAVKVLRDSRNEAVIPYLVEALRDDSPKVRREAVCSGMLFENEKMKRGICEAALEDEDEDVRLTAIEGLARSQSEMGMKCLREALSDLSGRVRQDTIVALGKLGVKDMILPFGRILEEEGFCKEGVSTSAFFQVDGLSLPLPDIAILPKAIKKEAIRILGQIGTEECVLILERALQNHGDLKKNIALALCSSDAGNVLPVLKGLLEGKDLDVEATSSIICKLGKIGDRDVREILRRYSESPKEEISACAKRALYDSGEESMAEEIFTDERLLLSELKALGKSYQTDFGFQISDFGFEGGGVNPQSAIRNPQSPSLLARLIEKGDRRLLEPLFTEFERERETEVKIGAIYALGAFFDRFGFSDFCDEAPDKP